MMKKILALTICIIFTSTSAAYPLPQDPEVVEGSADIAVDGNTMNIDASDNTIIDFQSFDISQGESVIVTLPSINSDILSRVLGDQATNIAGNLSCNGIFILVNDAGIYVASTAQIQAAGLVLSTLDINNQDFLNNNNLFQRLSEEQLNMLLVNEGNIAINEGGFAAFIAGAIENNGTIIAPLGEISLATGEAVTLDISGNDLISVAIDKEVASQVHDSQGNPITDQIHNTGTIEAQGGMIILDAHALPDIFTKAINLSGYVGANKLNDKDGTISLVCNDDVLLQGTLEADTGHIDVTAGEGTVENTGIIRTKLFTETGYSFSTSGTIEGGKAFYSNLDGAANISGDIGSDQWDEGNLIVVGNITLTADVYFWADSNATGDGIGDGNGVFSCDGVGFTITGGGHDLTIYSSQNNEGGFTADSIVVAISGVDQLIFNGSGSTPNYSAAGDISATRCEFNSGIFNANSVNITAGTGGFANGSTFNANSSTVT
ncbi:filamentous hemagglutinin N-terminal domain-containing protein, partial [Omnitrophica bacterium]|nr:filamentous hemagglutinin N-terminal domain-containing protein [Candidatus Omnitrophota bacterium]